MKPLKIIKVKDGFYILEAEFSTQEIKDIESLKFVKNLQELKQYIEDKNV